MTTRKVYCDNCLHTVKGRNLCGFTILACTARPETKDTSDHVRVTYTKCSEFNGGNDCSLYERKSIAGQIKRWFDRRDINMSSR